MEKELLVSLIEQKLTQREIADKVNKSQTTVRHWLNKYDLSTNYQKKPRGKIHYCYECGETNPEKFYGKMKEICGDCHNKRTIKKGIEKREYAIEKLGGECKSCGYKEHSCSLDIHHIDPSKKDSNFSSLRGWSLERIDREIENCLLLCKNCHAAHHAGLLDL